MCRMILLLPGPDRLQLANCHKYVTRGGDRAYSDIYTFTTINGACAAGVSKLLIIGHGAVGGVAGATVPQVVDAIRRSGLPLTSGCKIAFDTCWGGAGGAKVESVIMQVAALLKAGNASASVTLTGATGCTVTTGGAKRLVVQDARLDDAGAAQDRLTKKHGVIGIGDVRPDWSESASSAQIKIWAEEEFNKLQAFVQDLRAEMAADHMLDDSAGRKTKVQI